MPFTFNAGTEILKESYETFEMILDNKTGIMNLILKRPQKLNCMNHQ